MLQMLNISFFHSTLQVSSYFGLIAPAHWAISVTLVMSIEGGMKIRLQFVTVSWRKKEKGDWMSLRRAPVTSDSELTDNYRQFSWLLWEEPVSFGCNPLFLDWRGWKSECLWALSQSSFHQLFMLS